MSSVAAETSFLCVTDMASGFVFDKSRDSWKSAILTPREKYLVSKSTQKGYAWEVNEVGSKTPIAACKDDFNEIGILVCEGLKELRMNKNSGRFLAIYAIGYWNDNKNSKENDLFREGANTPSMEIGKCSPL